MATSRLAIDPAYLARADGAGFADAFARIESHYFVNKGFFPRDGYLLEKENIDKIRHIPTVIVQGRFDMVCPAKTAYDLKEQWPEAKFVRHHYPFVFVDGALTTVADEQIIIPDAGHSALEEGTQAALIKATDEFALL